MGHKATSYPNTSVSCIEQWKANRNSKQNDLQRDFLQGLPQAEEEKKKKYSGSVAGKLNTVILGCLSGWRGVRGNKGPVINDSYGGSYY